MQLAKCVCADLQMWHPNPKLIGAVTSTDLHFTHGLVEIFNCVSDIVQESSSVLFGHIRLSKRSISTTNRWVLVR